jgi:hypothetical protein
MHRSVVIHHRSAWWRSHGATSRCTAGSVQRCRSGRGGKRIAWATSSRTVLSVSQLLPEQKAVCPHRPARMPMKARPQPPLVLIPAPLTCGLCMALLDGLAALGNVHQRLPGRRGWQIAPIVRAFLRRPAGGPLPQQPANAGLVFRRQAPTPQCPALLAQPPRGPVSPADGAPRAPGQGRQPLGSALDWGGPCRVRHTAKSLRMATT